MLGSVHSSHCLFVSVRLFFFLLVPCFKCCALLILHQQLLMLN
uniref:Uncharacterized protein n=1 Tax=Anguilla anguilla TaxID=7936 RepID=A0A0E9REY2_ANGAN